MKQQGVTLIQMMLALAMAVLLTQLGMPAYARLSDDLHRAAAARDLAQALRSARSHALLQGQAVLVEAVDNDWGKGWRVMLRHNRQVLREHKLSRQLHIVANRGDQVTFTETGVTQGGNNGTLAVCERDTPTSQYRVVIATSGRVSLRTGASEQPRCAGA